MKDFIQTNFPELVLVLIIVVLAVMTLFFVHWHDDASATWARGLIAGIVLALTAVLNSIRQPKPNGSLNINETREKEKGS